MHCGITDCYFNIFLVEIQLKKENLKCFLGARVWAPESYTGFTNGLNMSLMEETDRKIVTPPFCL